MADNLIEEAKAGLREQARLQRAALGSALRSEAVELAANHFFANVELGKDQIVAAYWPIRDEIDCKPVLVRLMDSFQPVCLPVIMGDDVPLQFRRWELGAALYEAGFGTLAPADDAPRVEPDVIIIPLLGFDRAGTRLGYGKGHYDRTIAALHKKPTLIGYAFSGQELDSIPADDHDVPLDYLVTETGVTRFS